MRTMKELAPAARDVLNVLDKYKCDHVECLKVLVRALSASVCGYAEDAGGDVIMFDKAVTIIKVELDEAREIFIKTMAEKKM